MQKRKSWIYLIVLLPGLIFFLPSCGSSEPVGSNPPEVETQPADLSASAVPGEPSQGPVEADSVGPTQQEVEPAANPRNTGAPKAPSRPAQAPASRARVLDEPRANLQEEPPVRSTPASPAPQEAEVALNEKSGEPEEELDPDPEEFEFPAEVENRQPRVVEPVVVPAPPRRHDPVAIDFPTGALARNDSQPVGSDDWAILPEGTPISIRLDEEISTEFNRPGDTYRATLDEDLVVGGRIVVPRGTVMLGEIKSVSEPGKVKGRASITFALLSFRLGEQEYALRTSEVTMEAEANKGRDAAKVGAASAIGAVLGGIFGGKKGAAIGAATGAGAGTAGVLLSKGQHIRIEKERLFSFRLEEDVELSL